MVLYSDGWQMVFIAIELGGLFLIMVHDAHRRSVGRAEHLAGPIAGEVARRPRIMMFRAIK